MRKSLLLLLFGTGIFCTAPVRNYLEPQNKPAPDTLSQPIDTPSVNLQPLPESSQTIPVQNWPGHRFVLLEKQKMFAQYGYELYPCRELDSCKSAADTSLTGTNHRLRYDKFKGGVLRAKEVENAANEWLVTFVDEKTDLVVYGRTHKGSIKDLALESDLEAAKNRWLGKYVFSRKGVISTVLENQKGFGSIKIRVQDSLKVTDVHWGTTPLPVNPIWLLVETKDGKKGFIPVRYSWTNTLSEQIRGIASWGDDILEKDPSTEYAWPPETWEVINNHRIVIEMTREQVFLSWGEPLARLQKEIQGIQRECWVYGSQELYFDEKGLVTIEEKK
ncbi:MAG: hypothetical protein GX556_03360 [Fibrobacter sp.]|nr:hypothetical protein [Fibrobacter sp.]